MKRGETKNRGLGSQRVGAALRKAARYHEYIATTGAYAGDGNPVAFALAIGHGEVATVKLNQVESWRLIAWLHDQRADLQRSHPALADTLKRLAEQLEFAGNLQLEAVPAPSAHSLLQVGDD